MIAAVAMPSKTDCKSNLGTLETNSEAGIWRSPASTTMGRSWLHPNWVAIEGLSSPMVHPPDTSSSMAATLNAIMRRNSIAKVVVIVVVFVVVVIVVVAAPS